MQASRIILLLSLMALLSGCIKSNECKSPFVQIHKGLCCLDSNENNVCDNEETQTTTLIQMVDCGEDLQCFIDSVSNKQLSKVMYTVTVDIFGMMQTTTNYMEVQSYDGNNCVFYIQHKESSAEFAEGTPPEAIEASKKVYEAIKDRAGTCEFQTTELITLLNRWSEGSFSSSDWDNGDCNGEYFEASTILLE